MSAKDLGGLTVTAVSTTGASTSTTSQSAGGYSLALDPGTYTVTFSGGGYSSVTKTVTIGSKNVKLDLVDPAGAPVATPTAPIDGTAAGNTLNGTGGANTINGLAGNDRLYGKAGNDRLHGGTGNDKLYGDAGNDRLYGGFRQGHSQRRQRQRHPHRRHERRYVPLLGQVGRRTRSPTSRMPATTSICAAMV